MRLALNEYKAGIVNYTTVVTAQATALQAAQTLLTIRQNRLNASVALVQASAVAGMPPRSASPSGEAAQLAQGAGH